MDVPNIVSCAAKTFSCVPKNLHLVAEVLKLYPMSLQCDYSYRGHPDENFKINSLLLALILANPDIVN